jgi:hypothetical protein
VHLTAFCNVVAPPLKISIQCSSFLILTNTLAHFQSYLFNQVSFIPPKAIKVQEVDAMNIFFNTMIFILLGEVQQITRKESTWLLLCWIAVLNAVSDPCCHHSGLILWRALRQHNWISPGGGTFSCALTIPFARQPTHIGKWMIPNSDSQYPFEHEYGLLILDLLRGISAHFFMVMLSEELEDDDICCFCFFVFLFVYFIRGVRNPWLWIPFGVPEIWVLE